jgi:hypothetical protein
VLRCDFSKKATEKDTLSILANQPRFENPSLLSHQPRLENPIKMPPSIISQNPSPIRKFVVIGGFFFLLGLLLTGLGHAIVRFAIK